MSEPSGLEIDAEINSLWKIRSGKTVKIQRIKGPKENRIVDYYDYEKDRLLSTPMKKWLKFAIERVEHEPTITKTLHTTKATEPLIDRQYLHPILTKFTLDNLKKANINSLGHDLYLLPKSATKELVAFMKFSGMDCNVLGIDKFGQIHVNKDNSKQTLTISNNKRFIHANNHSLKILDDLAEKLNQSLKR